MERADALRFLPLDQSGCRIWRRVTRFDFFDRLPRIAVADTELLHLSHYGPLAIEITAHGPQVVLLLEPVLQKAPLATSQGRWRAPYAPMALRSLPFRPGFPDGFEIAPELATAGEGDPVPLDSAGEASPAFASISLLTGRLRTGARRLAEVAKVLIAADVTAPLILPDSSLLAGSAVLLGISPDRVGRLPANRAAALSIDHMLALDLLCACLFSQRHLSRRVTLQDVQEPARAADAADRTASHAYGEHLDLDVQVDNSPLFSFDLFESARATTDASA